MRIKYRKRKTTLAYLYPLFGGVRDAIDCEVGDLLIDMNGKLFRLKHSTGWGKRMAGELTPCEIKPPMPNLHAILEGGEIYWTDEIKEVV